MRRHENAEAGFTLVELLVAMTLATIVGGVLISLLIASRNVANSTTTANDLNAEARVALNRIARDLRQATPYTVGGVVTPAITAVRNPDGSSWTSGAVTWLTFDADFNNSGCLAGIASDFLPGFKPDVTPATQCTTGTETPDVNNPETVTYCWGGLSDQHLYLIAGGAPSTGCGSAGSLPLVADQVTDFEIYYRSNLYRYDANGDGITTWQELDQAGSPVGNNNGILDGPELKNINGVVLRITVAKGGKTQKYTTQVDLRDVS